MKTRNYTFFYYASRNDFDNHVRSQFKIEAPRYEAAYASFLRYCQMTFLYEPSMHFFAFQDIYYCDGQARTFKPSDFGRLDYIRTTCLRRVGGSNANG